MRTIIAALLVISPATAFGACPYVHPNGQIASFPEPGYMTIQFNQTDTMWCAVGGQPELGSQFIVECPTGGEYPAEFSAMIDSLGLHMFNETWPQRCPGAA